MSSQPSGLKYGDILRLARKIKTNQIDALGDALQGFEDADISRFKNTNEKYGNTYEGALDMLQSWKERHRRADQIPKLKEAIEEAGILELLDDKVFQNIGSSSTDEAGAWEPQRTKRKTESSSFVVEKTTPGPQLEQIKNTKIPCDKSEESTDAGLLEPENDVETDILEENDVYLDKNGVFTLQVQKTAPEQQTKKQKKYQITNSQKKNRMLIVNIQGEGNKIRRGSKVDVANVERVFSQLGYEPETVPNTDILKALKEFKDSVNIEKTNSAIVVFIMSHGNETHVQNQDGSIVPRSEIRKVLTEMTTMRGKPKILFSQTCRGGAIPDMVSPDLIQSQEIASSQVESDEITLTDNADIYEASATADGYKAFRSATRGSWFVHYLCKELYDNAHQCDLDTMMENVTDVLSQKSCIYENKVMCQTPSVTKTTRKKIFFLTQ